MDHVAVANAAANRQLHCVYFFSQFYDDFILWSIYPTAVEAENQRDALLKAEIKSYYVIQSPEEVGEGAKCLKAAAERIIA